MLSLPSTVVRLMPKPVKTKALAPPEIIDIHSSEFHDALLEFCDQCLSGLHCSQWGQSWSVHNDVERRQAADWLAATMIEVISISEGEAVA